MDIFNDIQSGLNNANENGKPEKNKYTKKLINGLLKTFLRQILIVSFKKALTYSVESLIIYFLLKLFNLI